MMSATGRKQNWLKDRCLSDRNNKNIAIEKETLNKNTQEAAKLSRLLLAFFLVLLPCCAGCSENGPPRVPVSGRVSIDGKPLEQGTILFVPELGTPGPKSGAEIVKGEFALDGEQGPGIGKLRVKIQNSRDANAARYDRPPELIEQSPTPIPNRYNSHSELVIETSETEDNFFEFKLTSDPPETE